MSCEIHLPSHPSKDILRRIVLPAGVDVDFGAGSKLLRGVVTLGGAGGAARLAPLGASLEGRAAFRAGGSSFPKVEPAGGKRQVNHNLMKNGWAPLPFAAANRSCFRT